MNLARRIRIVLDKIRFYLRYREAMRKHEEVQMLARCILETLYAESDSKLEIFCSLTSAPGYNLATSPICWEAPACFLLRVDGQPIFGVGIEFSNDWVHIRQLHGVAGAVIPGDLRRWPRMCVSAIIEYAKEAPVVGVRLYRAHKDLFYEAPFVGTPERSASPEERSAIRQRMRRRYDGTARQLGFTMMPDWGEFYTGV